MKRRWSILPIALGALALAACQTVPTEIPEDLTQPELIQLAQDAADQDNWDAAIAYYSAIQARFTQEPESVAIVRYEIAFINYKRGALDEARDGFTQLLGMYDFEADVLPEWPRILAERLLAEIDGASSTAEG